MPSLLGLRTFSKSTGRAKCCARVFNTFSTKGDLVIHVQIGCFAAVMHPLAEQGLHACLRLRCSPGRMPLVARRHACAPAKAQVLLAFPTAQSMVGPPFATGFPQPRKRVSRMRDGAVVAPLYFQYSCNRGAFTTHETLAAKGILPPLRPTLPAWAGPGAGWSRTA